jgi:hypothetical protein
MRLRSKCPYYAAHALVNVNMYEADTFPSRHSSSVLHVMQGYN